jgi:hypothetical protein
MSAKAGIPFVFCRSTWIRPWRRSDIPASPPLPLFVTSNGLVRPQPETREIPSEKLA